MAVKLPMKKRAFQISRYGWQRDLPDHLSRAINHNQPNL